MSQMSEIIWSMTTYLEAKMFRMVLLKTTITKFIFDFCAILAPHHEIYKKRLSLLKNF